MRFFSRQVAAFAADERATITVDYMVLGAAIVVLGVSTIGAIQSGTFATIGNVVDELDKQGCVVTGQTGTTYLSACN